MLLQITIQEKKAYSKVHIIRKKQDQRKKMNPKRMKKNTGRVQSELAREAVLNLMSFVIVMIKVLGILMTVIGVAGISFAFCAEDEEGKNKSASMIAMGIALLTN